MPPVITLTTDFGLKDGNVGVMKGVIWKISPAAQIADLSHLVSPQNIAEAALLIERAAPFFPKNTVHLAVVDPGVGTDRRPVAARVGAQFCVGPDNGLFTRLYQQAEDQGLPVQVYHLDQPQFWLQKVSSVFHGRDIFAPVAAYLASGTPLEKLGSLISDPVHLSLPQPQAAPGGLLGEIIHIDHFGNLSCNITRQHLGEKPVATIRVCGVNIGGMVNTFGERPPGELVALYGSCDNLIISVVNGSAAQRLNASLGDAVEVFFKD